MFRSLPPSRSHSWRWRWLGLAGLLIGLAACAAPASLTQPAAAARLQVMATTSILGDVVGQVAGEAADVRTLLPVDADPHGFQPTPADVVLLSQADLVFVNGLGLEELLMSLLAGAVPAQKVIAVSEVAQIEPLADAQEHESAGGEEEHEHNDGFDPHIWTDPNHVILWADVIAAALSQADPAHAAVYQANAEAYRRELQALDAWIREQVDQTSPAQRKLVTEHTTFAYFARRYGFEQVGAIIPGFSTLAEPSAQTLAALEDAIREMGVQAIFVGNTVNPRLAERVAADTGIRLIPVYSDSLSAADGPAATYLAYMRYNTRAFVEGMK